MGQPRQGERIIVSIIEQNLIAAHYLLELLKDNSRVCPLLLEEFLKRAANSVNPIFLLDNWALSLPITEWLRRLAPRYPYARYLLLDKGKPDDEIARMLCFGVHGFVEHGEVPRTLLDAVYTVSEGRVWASPEVLHLYVRATAHVWGRRMNLPEPVTSRETQIIELVRRRLSNKEIASILRVQESTVKFHLSNIFNKFRVASRRDLLIKDEAPNAWGEILA